MNDDTKTPTSSDEGNAINEGAQNSSDSSTELSKETNKKEAVPVSKEENQGTTESEEKKSEESENNTHDEQEESEEIKKEMNTGEEEKEQDFSLIPEKEFQERTKELVLPSLLKFFRPELINRFDDVIFFHPLRKIDLRKIVDIMLLEPREMLREKNIEFRLSDEAKGFLSEKGYNPAFGARPLRRAIQEYLEDPLSDSLISEDFVSGDRIFIDLNEAEDGLIFQKDVADEKDQKALDPYAKLEEESQEDEGTEIEENEKSENNETQGEGGEKEGENQSESEENEEEEDEAKDSSDDSKEGQDSSSEDTKKKGSIFSKMFHKGDDEKE